MKERKKRKSLKPQHKYVYSREFEGIIWVKLGDRYL